VSGKALEEKMAVLLHALLEVRLPLFAVATVIIENKLGDPI